MTDQRSTKSGVKRVTDEDIIKAIAEIGPRASVTELCDRFDYSGSAMRDRIRQLRDEGRVEIAYHNYNQKLYSVTEGELEAAVEESRPSLPEVTKQVQNGDIDVDDLASTFADLVDLIQAADSLEASGDDEDSDPGLENMIEAVENEEVDIDELASVFDDITRLIQTSTNRLSADQQQELAEKLGMSALIARSPGLYFRDLRNHVESSRDRMGVSSRSEDSVSVR